MSSRRSSVFQFRHFEIQQERSRMKVCTDSCIFGAWVAHRLPFETQSALDVGCGTGLLGLMALQKHPNLEVTGIEPDEGSFSDAILNAKESDWANRMEVFQSDWESWSGRGYDVVISNPPFFVDQLPSGNPGDRTAKHLSSEEWTNWLTGLVSFLKEDGRMYLLIHPAAWVQARKILGDYGFQPIEQVGISQEGKGIWRIMACFSRNEENGMKPIELPLYSEEGSFSDKLIFWLSDFYRPEALHQKKKI